MKKEQNQPQHQPNTNNQPCYVLQKCPLHSCRGYSKWSDQSTKKLCKAHYHIVFLIHPHQTLGIQSELGMTALDQASRVLTRMNVVKVSERDEALQKIRIEWEKIFPPTRSTEKHGTT